MSLQTPGQCEHVWRVTSSPIVGDSRVRYCKCALCGGHCKQTVPIEYAPKKQPSKKSAA